MEPLLDTVRTICSDDDVWKNRIPWHPPVKELFNLMAEFVDV